MGVAGVANVVTHSRFGVFSDHFSFGKLFLTLECNGAFSFSRVGMQSFTGGTKLEEMGIVAEEPHGSPVSSSAAHTPKPSETLQDSLVQNTEELDVIQDLGQSQSEGVAVSVCVSPTVDVPAGEEEEELQQEEQEEEREEMQEQQEENEEEEELQQEEEEQEEEREEVQEQHEENEEEEEDDEDAQSEG